MLLQVSQKRSSILPDLLADFCRPELQGGRFYSNTLGLRDITKPEELLPLHIPCLRTALDAAVRIQGKSLSFLCGPLDFLTDLRSHA